MTATGGLEQSYRRLLRWYPPPYRRRHEEEILGVLMATAHPGQRRPGGRESFDLLWSALRIRIRLILRGTDSQPWAAALTMAGVLLPLLMVLLKLTGFLDQGARYGFGTPADAFIGAFGRPGAYARSFQLSPYSLALTSNLASALTAGPVPALIMAVLACLGWRRAAAGVAVFASLAYIGIALSSGFTLLADPRGAVTLYAYGLAAVVLLAAPATPRGWRALRWRPSALLAAATVAAGIAVNGGIWPLLPHAPSAFGLIRGHHLARYPFPRIPNGFLNRLFGIGPSSGWADWLLYQGTLVAVIVVALAIMLMSSPVNRRVLALFGIPFVLGAVMYLLSLISPPPPGAAGNALVAVPLVLMLLLAVAVLLAHTGPAGPDSPSRPVAPE